MDTIYTVEMFRDEVMMNLKVIDIRLANLKEQVKKTNKLITAIHGELINKPCEGEGCPDQMDNYF